jgi:hypothetical protein
MATFKYALAALRVITDRETSSTSYIDVIDGFTVGALPAPLPPFSIAALWEQGERTEPLAIRMSLTGPDEHQDIPPFAFPVQTVTAKAHHRVNLNFAGVVLPLAGRYLVHVEEQRNAEWTEVGMVTLDIRYAPQQRPTAVLKQPDGTQVPLRQ